MWVDRSFIFRKHVYEKQASIKFNVMRNIYFLGHDAFNFKICLNDSEHGKFSIIESTQK